MYFFSGFVTKNYMESFTARDLKLDKILFRYIKQKWNIQKFKRVMELFFIDLKEEEVIDKSSQ